MLYYLYYFSIQKLTFEVTYDRSYVISEWVSEWVHRQGQLLQNMYATQISQMKYASDETLLRLKTGRFPGPAGKPGDLAQNREALGETGS